MAARVRNLRYRNLALIAQKLLGLMERWNINFTSRKQLLDLDDDQLRDIGIDHEAAQREGKKYFWRS